MWVIMQNDKLSYTQARKHLPHSGIGIRGGLSFMITAAYIYVEKFAGLRTGDAERLTHVNLSFALVKDGKGSVDHWSNTEIIRELVRNKGKLKVILAVGGWGAGGFSPAVATEESRELFAQSLVDIVDDFGLDGIDMDWEYPCDSVAGIEASPADKPNYTAFIQLLRDKLGNDKIITMAAGGMQSCADNLEIPKLVELMDFFNIMTYDMCPWDYVSYHPSLYPSDFTKNNNADTVIRIYEKAGVPRNKLVIGAAFYGRVYRDVDGLNAPSGIPGFSGGYTDTLNLAEAASGVQYDEKAETAYAYNAKDRIFLTFDNSRSLKAKIDYVQSTGLAGLMFWEYSQDTDDSTLIKTIFHHKNS